MGRSTYLGNTTRLELVYNLEQIDNLKKQKTAQYIDSIPATHQQFPLPTLTSKVLVHSSRQWSALGALSTAVWFAFRSSRRPQWLASSTITTEALKEEAVEEESVEEVSRGAFEDVRDESPTSSPAMCKRIP